MLDLFRFLFKNKNNKQKVNSGDEESYIGSYSLKDYPDEIDYLSTGTVHNVVYPLLELQLASVVHVYKKNLCIRIVIEGYTLPVSVASVLHNNLPVGIGTYGDVAVNFYGTTYYFDTKE